MKRLTDAEMLEKLLTSQDGRIDTLDCFAPCTEDCSDHKYCPLGQVISELRKRVKGWEQFRGDPPDHKPPPPKSVTTKTILCYEGEEHEFKEQPHD